MLVADRLWVVVERAGGRSQAGARLEAHRRFIDIQLVVDGHERIGWVPLGDCAQATEPYCDDRDIVFYENRPTTWLEVSPGQFCVFFPSDAHAPLAGTGDVLKAVAKVAVVW